MKPAIKIIAHRGYSSLYPDNSLEAFGQAVKAGAEVIETDIRMAKDGSLGVQGVLVNDPKQAVQVRDEKPKPPSPPGMGK